VVQHLDELLDIVGPFLDSGALQSWEAALSMNHIARLLRRHQKVRGRDEGGALLAEARLLLSRLIGPVLDGAETLKPKGLAWALNACRVLPKIAMAQPPTQSIKGLVASGTQRPMVAEEKEDGNAGASLWQSRCLTRDEALSLLVPAMLHQLPRYHRAAQDHAAPQVWVQTPTYTLMANPYPHPNDPQP
jgi:hypothetical protein